jgi:hypothetical protein
MSCTRTLALIGALALSGSQALAGSGAAPPEQTLRQLDEVTKLLDDREFDGSYRADVVSWRGPRDDQIERRETFRARKKASDPVDGELVSAIEDGEDITETRRAEIAEQEAERGDEPRQRPFADFHLPGWENREAYSWEALASEDGSCTARFEPMPELQEEESVGRGQLAWHCESLDPLRMQLVPEELPRLVNESTMSWLFARQDGFLLTRRFEWRVAGGLPFFKRSFRLVIEISEFHIDPAGAMDSGSEIVPNEDSPGLQSRPPERSEQPAQLSDGSRSGRPPDARPDPR